MLANNKQAIKNVGKTSVESSRRIKSVVRTDLSSALKKLSGPPIIFAPLGASEVLSMFNIEDFLLQEK